MTSTSNNSSSTITLEYVSTIDFQRSICAYMTPSTIRTDMNTLCQSWSNMRSLLMSIEESKRKRKRSSKGKSGYSLAHN